MAEWTTADTVQMLRNYWYGVKSAWALAVVVAFLFACVTVAHIAFLALKRRWFMIPLTLAALRTSPLATLNSDRTLFSHMVFRSLLTFLQLRFWPMASVLTVYMKGIQNYRHM